MSQTYYEKPLILCYSGGKDSDVLLHIAESVLNPKEFEVLNSHTTIDPPEVVYHIRDTFKRLNGGGIVTTITNLPTKNQTQITMWDLIVKKGIPPTRLQRYCCATLKEVSTPNRLAVLGVRSAESTKRQGRDTFGIRGGHTGRLHFFLLTIQKRCITKQKNVILYGIAP